MQPSSGDTIGIYSVSQTQLHFRLQAKNVALKHRTLSVAQETLEFVTHFTFSTPLGLFIMFYLILRILSPVNVFNTQKKTCWVKKVPLIVVEIIKTLHLFCSRMSCPLPVLHSCRIRCKLSRKRPPAPKEVSAPQLLTILKGKTQFPFKTQQRMLEH